MTASCLDERLLRFLRTAGHTPAAERAVARFSRLGEHGGLWIAIGGCGWAVDPARRSRWARALGCVVGAYVLNTTIKLVCRRRRPQLDGLPPLAPTPTELSFPSAHSATAFAGALAYSRLGLPARPLYGLASATALSRLYLGLHYPSDVVAGAALGTAVSAALGRRPRAAEPGQGSLA
jgi:decaprenylphosphoryl-5-phosphoribose phosphatase